MKYAGIKKCLRSLFELITVMAGVVWVNHLCVSLKTQTSWQL
jgi:hypothetical protein